MFKVLVSRQRRRAWSPATVAISVGAHLLLVGVVLAAPGRAEPPPPLVYTEIRIPLPQEPAAAVQPEPVAPQAPSDPLEPLSVPGETLVLTPPADVPRGIPDVDPSLRPITADQVTGLGRPGDHIGTPAADPQPLTGNPDPAPPPPDDWVPSAASADVVPALSNRTEVSRVLQRHYPRMLQDTGVEGEVLVEMIVDVNGRVRPGSARVLDASHEGFSAATLRAVEHFRFRPARIADRPVAVRVTFPVSWNIHR